MPFRMQSEPPGKLPSIGNRGDLKSAHVQPNYGGLCPIIEQPEPKSALPPPRCVSHSRNQQPLQPIKSVHDYQNRRLQRENSQVLNNAGANIIPSQRIGATKGAGYAGAMRQPRQDQPSYAQNENRYMQKNNAQLSRNLAAPAAPPRAP